MAVKCVAVVDTTEAATVDDVTEDGRIEEVEVGDTKAVDKDGIVAVGCVE